MKKQYVSCLSCKHMMIVSRKGVSPLDYIVCKQSQEIEGSIERDKIKFMEVYGYASCYEHADYNVEDKEVTE